MRRRLVAVVAAAIATVLWPSASSAQNRTAASATAPLEISAGVGFLGGSPLDAGSASLRGRSGGDFSLFRTDSTLAGTIEPEVRISYALNRRYSVEARLGWSHPELRTEITADFEGAPESTLVEQLDQYVVDGTFVVTLDALRAGGVVPFIAAGAGYLRQLHEGQMLVEEGIAYHAGGGVRVPLFGRPRGIVRRAGVRVDARVNFHSGGVNPDGNVGIHPRLGGSFFVAF